MVYGSGLLMNHTGSADAPGPKICVSASAGDPALLRRPLKRLLVGLSCQWLLNLLRPPHSQDRSLVRLSFLDDRFIQFGGQNPTHFGR